MTIRTLKAFLHLFFFCSCLIWRKKVFSSSTCHNHLFFSKEEQGKILCQSIEDSWFSNACLMTKAHFFRTDSMCVFVETNKECSIFRGGGTQRRNSCMCYCRNSECIFRLITEILPQRSKWLVQPWKMILRGHPPFLSLVSLVSLYIVLCF